MTLSPYLFPTVAARTISARAYDTLTAEARSLLWYHDIERLPAQNVAELCGITADTLCTHLATAREAFMTSWLGLLTQTMNDHTRCSTVIAALPRRCLGRLTQPQCDDLDTHLTTCGRCALLAEEITTVCDHLGVALLPLVLGTTAWNWTPHVTLHPHRR